MNSHMLNLISAELFQLRKRTSTWVLLVIWMLMGVTFGYLLPYLTLDDNAFVPGSPALALLPEHLISGAISGFPFYGGAIVLILGVLVFGSDYTWNTGKLLYTQRPGRGKVFAARIAAMVLTMAVFTVGIFASCATISTGIAVAEGQTIVWPPLSDVVLAIGAGWLILSVWSTVGVALATVTRGTSLAIGIGIIWALALEGMLAAFASSLSWLGWTNDVMLRANAYSLVKPLTTYLEADGPGYFAGPYVSVPQALFALVALAAACLTASYVLIERRDIA